VTTGKPNWKHLAAIGIVLTVLLTTGLGCNTQADAWEDTIYFDQLYAWNGTAYVNVGTAAGSGGGLWEVDGTETQLIVADELDIQNKSILNVLDIDGVDIGTLDTTVSSHTTALANLVIGTDVQAWDDDLDDIAGLTPTDGNFIVGDGADWTTESGATARTSLGLGTGNTPQFTGVEVGDASDTTLARSGAGHVSVEGDVLLGESDVDDAPANGDTSDPISSNWAYDNAAIDATQDSDIDDLQDIAIVYIVDGGGSTITTGEKGHLDIPFDCTITGWILLADQSGSIVIDVWKDTYANFPPTVADSIAGSEEPALSAAQKNEDLALGTWTTSVTADDILAFNVESCTNVTRVTLTMTATRG